MNCMDLTSKRTKMLNYVPNHLKHSKTTKVIKLRWSAWIWRQNDQKCWVTSQTIPNTAKLQKWSNYDELDRFDVKTIKNVELRPKPFKTTQTYKSNQIAMNWIDLMSKTSNNAKLQKWSNYDEVHGLDVKTNKNVESRRKPFKTTQIYKGYQSTMNCIDLMSKRTKMMSYVGNHSKQRKSTKVFKLRWIASIWCQKHQTTQNYKSDQITRKCMDLTSKRTKMLSYVPNHSKQRKSTKFIKVQWIASIWCQKHQTTQNYKSDQITMNWIDLTSKRSKMFSYVPNHSKQLKPTKVIKLQWIASIWCQKHQTTQNYKSDQITRTCMDLTSKRTKMLSYVPNHSKQRKSTKFIKVQWIASIWCQKHQTTQNYKSDQITMNCIDLT